MCKKQAFKSLKNKHFYQPLPT